MAQETALITETDYKELYTIAEYITQELIESETPFQVKWKDIGSKNDDDMTVFDVFYSGKNIDTIRIELTVSEMEKSVSMLCELIKAIPGGCNEESLKMECEKLNFLYGNRAEFIFFNEPMFNDSLIFVTNTVELGRGDMDWVFTYECFAKRSLLKVKDLVNTVDFTYLDLLCNVWKNSKC